MTAEEFQLSVEKSAQKKNLTKEEYLEIADIGSQISFTKNLDQAVQVIFEETEGDLNEFTDACFFLGAIYQLQNGTASEKVIQLVNVKSKT